MTGAATPLYARHAGDADQALLGRASAEMGCWDLSALSEERVARIATDRGLDFATALLYLAVREADANRPMINAIDGAEDGTLGAEAPTIVLMPGAFHRHHTHTGANGERICNAAEQLGWPTPQVVELSSLGSLRANGEALIQHLLGHRSQRVLLVSLSKSSADVGMAMRDTRAVEAFSRVCGWVSLSGLLFGTPLINWLARRPLRALGVRLILWSRGLSYAPLSELRRTPDSILQSVPVLPAHLRAIHVVGFPLRRHLRHPWAHNGYDRLSSLGPSDGGGFLLADARLLPGGVYPVWGADHYLDPPWDFAPLLRNILLHAAASASAASAIPATRSTA